MSRAWLFCGMSWQRMPQNMELCRLPPPRLSVALLHVCGLIDDLQVRDAPEGQQCRPRSIAMVAPDLEQGNLVIDLGILEQPFAGCGTAAPLKNLQVPNMIARRNP